MLLVLAFVVVAVFLMVRLIPGDPAFKVVGLEGDPGEIERVRQELGLNESLLSQFGTYLSNLAHGDLGTSFRSVQPVAELIGERIGVSLQLAAAALFLVTVVAIPLGVLMGALTREGRHPRIEVFFTGSASVVGAIPDYLTATLLAFLFAVTWEIFPVAGADGLDALVLPALAVSIAPIANLSRIVRVEMLNALAQDYVRTARSRRLPSRIVYFRHAGPNVLTAALTVGGLLFASLIGGAIVVETVFARPGLGTALIDAVLQNDYPVVQGITLVLGATVVIVNALVDVLVAIADPRSLTRER